MRLIKTGAWSVVMVGVLVSAPSGWAQDSEKSAPCSAAEHAQFDFWVGEWSDAFVGIYTRQED